jgi:hypothetical protein
VLVERDATTVTFKGPVVAQFMKGKTMHPDTLVLNVGTYTKFSTDAQSGTTYHCPSGPGGAANPNILTIKQTPAASPGNGKGTVRTLIQFTGPMLDSSAVVLPQRNTVNLTITTPNVPNDGSTLNGILLDLIVAISNGTTADAFLTNSANGML